MVGLCVLLVMVGVVISGASCYAIARWAVPRDVPGSEAHKQHERAVPSLGGIGIALAVVVPAAVGVAMVWWFPESWWSGQTSLASIANHLPGLQQTTPMAVLLLLAMTVMHGLGVWDDRHGLGAGLKLLIELIVAAVLVMATDTRVLMLLDNWGPIGYGISVGLTVLWIATITNAMNMLDNMNGLAGGVGLIIAAALMLAAIGGGQWFVAGLSGLMVGGLAGFLVWNYPQARLFMGDGGSLMLGLLIAFVSVRLTYWASGGPAVGHAVGSAEQGGQVGQVGQVGHWIGVLAPVGFMAVPLYDLIKVTAIRVKMGARPWVGDQNHVSHRLVRRGWSKPSAVALLWGCTAVTCAMGLLAWWLGNASR